jgi:hypothetical protein
MLGSFGSMITSLVGLALIFVMLWEFFRGMRALAEIATHLGRIEHILAGGPPSVPRPSASHSGT